MKIIEWANVIGDRRKQEILLSEDLRSCLLALLFAVQLPDAWPGCSVFTSTFHTLLLH